MNETGGLSLALLCYHCHVRCYAPLRLFSFVSHFVFTYGLLLYFCQEVTRRISPVPLNTFWSCRSPYPERIFGAAFRVFRAFRGLHHFAKARLPLVHVQAGSFDEAARFTLCNDLFICLHSSRGLLCHRAPALGFLHHLPVSCRASWNLLGLNFHQLAMNCFLNKPEIRKPAFIKAGLSLLLIIVVILLQI